MIKKIVAEVGIFGGLLGAIFLGVRGCNGILNNRSISNPSYTFHSYSKGLSGHVEYTEYSDGSRDVKIYPGLSHRFFDSEFHQDLNGDGKIDRIRQNGAEWKMNKMSELLIREKDYSSNSERFDEADEQLHSLINKYDN